jgi:hypothetical protein
MEEDSAETLASLARPLYTTDIVVHVHVKLAEWRPTQMTTASDWKQWFRSRRTRVASAAGNRDRRRTGGVGQRVRDGIQTMGRRIPLQAGIGEVGDRLSWSAEIGRRVDPAHRESQWECNKWFFPWFGGEHDPHLGNIRRIDPQAVEAISDVDLDQVDGAEARIGVEDALQDTPKGPSKLHGLVRC